MELTKHQNHRNTAYLNWLRKQNCVISGQKAQCAHHIRLGTNGGSSLKPSDYFCVPLLNEYHTTGLFAIHCIGEETFFKQFKLNRNKLFISYLNQYVIEKYDRRLELTQLEDNEAIARLIHFIEEKVVKSDRPKKKATKKVESTTPKVSITENEFYQKAKEEKNKQDRELRAKLKDDAKFEKMALKTKTKKKTKNSSSLKDNDYYQRAKEQKRLHDKELRQQIKANAKKTKKVSVTQSDFYQKAKEQKRERDKELRAMLKLAKKNKKGSKKNGDIQAGY